MGLTTDLQVTLTAVLTGTRDIGTPTHRIPYTFTDQLTSGTGLDQADQVFEDERTLNASTSEDLDLAGSLTNGLGQTVTFARVKLIIIENVTTTAGYNLGVGGASSNQFVNWVANSSDIVNVGPGGLLLLYNPSATAYAVTSGTGDLLKINNGNAGAVVYRIIVVGATA